MGVASIVDSNNSCAWKCASRGSTDATATSDQPARKTPRPLTIQYEFPKERAFRSDVLLQRGPDEPVIDVVGHFLSRNVADEIGNGRQIAPLDGTDMWSYAIRLGRTGLRQMRCEVEVSLTLWLAG